MKPVTYDDFTEDIQILTKRYLSSRDAYVTGFFFTTIDYIPQGFIDFLKDEYGSNWLGVGYWNEREIIKIFTSLSIEVALPQEALKTITSPGIGGYSRTCPLHTQPGNIINVTFQVDQDLRVTSLLRSWYKYITMTADGRYEVKSGISEGAHSNIYGCNFYYCTLLPNMEDIVYAFIGESFYPLSQPQQDMGHGVSTNDSLKHNIAFNIDYYQTWTNGNSPNEWIRDILYEKFQYYLGMTVTRS